MSRIRLALVAALAAGALVIASAQAAAPKLIAHRRARVHHHAHQGRQEGDRR